MICFWGEVWKGSKILFSRNALAQQPYIAVSNVITVLSTVILSKFPILKNSVLFKPRNLLLLFIIYFMRHALVMFGFSFHRTQLFQIQLHYLIDYNNLQKNLIQSTLKTQSLNLELFFCNVHTKTCLSPSHKPLLAGYK